MTRPAAQARRQPPGAAGGTAKADNARSRPQERLKDSQCVAHDGVAPDASSARQRRPRIVLPRQSEASWQATVLQYATLRGWHHWHDNATNAPRRCGECGAIRKFRRNAAGWLDLVLVRRPRLIFAELKREGEQPTEDQQAWIEELRACGQEVFVWTPRDWPDVERVLL